MPQRWPIAQWRSCSDLSQSLATIEFRSTPLSLFDSLRLLQRVVVCWANWIGQLSWKIIGFLIIAFKSFSWKWRLSIWWPPVCSCCKVGHASNVCTSFSSPVTSSVYLFLLLMVRIGRKEATTNEKVIGLSLHFSCIRHVTTNKQSTFTINDFNEFELEWVQFQLEMPSFKSWKIVMAQW